MNDFVQVSDIASPVDSLGPASAAVIWADGCRLACIGCMSKDTWSGTGGRRMLVSELASWLESTGMTNLTISGGEPFDQAAAFHALIVELRRTDRSWAVTVYSGYTYEELLADGPDGALELLSEVDLLIDGRYEQSLHASLLWRGSSNQRLHYLTDRIEPQEDESVGVEVHVDARADVRFIGVPPHPDFVKTFQEAAVQIGTSVNDRPAPPFVVSTQKGKS